MSYLKNAPTFDGAVTVTGTLTVNGFGTHAFSAGGIGSNTLSVRNTTAGTGNYSSVFVGNDASASNFYLQSYSSTYTTAGRSVADGGTLEASRAGGMSIVASDASGDVRVYAGGTTLRWVFSSNGSVTYYATDGSTPGISFNGGVAASSPSSLAVSSAGWGTTHAGSLLSVGRNTSGGGAAGTLGLIAKDGTAYYLWVDTAGKVRVNTSQPIEGGSDTGGTIIGTQS